MMKGNIYAITYNCFAHIYRIVKSAATTTARVNTTLIGLLYQIYRQNLTTSITYHQNYYSMICLYLSYMLVILPYVIIKTLDNWDYDSLLDKELHIMKAMSGVLLCGICSLSFGWLR